MEIGIIGLPRSGKTTIFNAVTRGRADVAGYSNRPNVGVAKVPDERLDTLARMYQPKRITPAEVTYTDIPPPPEGLGNTRGISGEYLNAIQSVDAILVVVRAFQNSSVPHVDETINPIRDTENMLMEMTFSDLDILDRRVARIQDGFKKAGTQDRIWLTQERGLLLRIKENINSGIALKDQPLSPDEIKMISGFGFLSLKPLIVAMNIDEEQIEESVALEKQLWGILTGQRVRPAVICAQLEMELAQMEPDDEKEFRGDLGVAESSLNRMIQISYDVVDQVSFFTVGEDEVRAWEIPRHTTAQQAAGKIHTDLERGFIRAEVVAYEKLIESGGLTAARKLGFLRQEGKDYIVGDGEIMHVLFNV
ncbi:redox-regulated ATPase YchF [Dehalococcoidia bacterium]|nr:redox-regulated ATPase YchF [Dehalococcoidia bacterium]